MNVTSPAKSPPLFFAWLTIAAALVTFSLKMGMWAVTGSVAFASDAMESVVNLVTAVSVLLAFIQLNKPADARFNYGRSKAEFIVEALEGLMIIVAALGIAIVAIPRLFDPQPVAESYLGIGFGVVAALLNGVVAWALRRGAVRHKSVALRAESAHLMADVYTSVGVVVAVIGVWVTGWLILDPLIALAVAGNILWQGAKHLRGGLRVLVDESWPEQDNNTLVTLLASYQKPGEVLVHGVRTREAGKRRFAEAHILVPGDWTVRQGHDLADRIEQAVAEEFTEEQVHMVCHVEPLEDARAYGDYETELAVPGPEVRGDNVQLWAQRRR